VIDPILQSTYLGGSNNDYVRALAIHPTTGDVYVAGTTDSTDFPNTFGGAQVDRSDRRDVFVSRLNSNLTRILQSTYLGGSGRDEAYALTIHPTTGEVYVAGTTDSTNFPNTTGGAQANNRGLTEAFVARLNSDLTKILQATYLGGNYWDEAKALAIHPKTGDVYVAGQTSSTNFPRTFGGTQERFGGGPSDAFVARLNSDLTQILQSAYLGGRDGDEAKALAIHPKTGEVYVAGLTWSKDFPKTAGGAQTNCNNCAGGTLPIYDAFVARLNSDLTQILQSTYLGGRERDDADAIAIHPKTGEVYVAGYTDSTNFPNTTGGAQANKEGSRDAFVARFNSDLTQILQATYLGGRGGDWARALAIHPISGEVYVAGYTDSTNFPNTSGGAQVSKAGPVSYSDAFVARLNSDLTKILQATYLGGNYWDEAYTLAIHPKTGDVYVAGSTQSTDFPNTTGGAQTSMYGVTDAFVARLSADLAAGKSSDSGGGFYMTGSVSSLTGAWTILLLLSFPAFVVARRIRRK
jgi:hypothetical protein